MPEDNFRLVTVKELLGKSFFIPRYQRGYRWGKQQVIDLLNDINESEGQYCLQPLVVQKRLNDPQDFRVKINGLEQINDSELLPATEKVINEADFQYEVIDGQQRLTTIYIILKYLDIKENYSIEYETRTEAEFILDDNKKKGSELFLHNIKNCYEEAKRNSKETNNSESNIDFFHMWQCYDTVANWFEPEDHTKERPSNFKTDFQDKLLNNVNFIWYVDDSGKPVDTFTRLNIGKIALTNAELIKAMLLKQSNFKTNDVQAMEAFRLTQLEMAAQWDEIEFTLQDIEFWGFIHPSEWNKPTRIDFIFDLIKKLNKELKFLRVKNGNEAFEGKDLGNDKYTTFRYFYQYLNQNKGPTDEYKTIWNAVRQIFQIFREWFNDVTFYHYIGFLTDCNEQLEKYIKKWKDNNKDTFNNFIIDEIKNKIACLKDLHGKKTDKQKWMPLLLLFNVQTVINQNGEYARKYGNGLFYKFPFHLFRQEKWHIEHVDSATENDLNKDKDQKEWLKNIYLYIELLEINDKSKNDIKQSIYNFIHNINSNDIDSFENLKEQISNFLKNNDVKIDVHIEEDKDILGNYTLLDSSTNCSYKNAIFPFKRKVIIGKEQGLYYEIKDDLNIERKENIASFIPPCTRNVFMKYYTPNSTDIMSWTQQDAEAYIKQIYETLKDFGVEDPSKS